MTKRNGHAPTPSSDSPSSTSSRARKSPLPTTEAIRLRAYEMYLERNGAPGDPLEDWVRAENELLHAGGKKVRRLLAKSA